MVNLMVFQFFRVDRLKEFHFFPEWSENVFLTGKLTSSYCKVVFLFYHGLPLFQKDLDCWFLSFNIARRSFFLRSADLDTEALDQKVAEKIILYAPKQSAG